jgi:hypothetical protein
LGPLSLSPDSHPRGYDWVRESRVA